jgi:hypothetical protein
MKITEVRWWSGEAKPFRRSLISVPMQWTFSTFRLTQWGPFVFMDG